MPKAAPRSRAPFREPAEKGDIKAVIDGFDKQFAAYQIADKTERQAAVGEVRTAIEEKPAMVCQLCSGRQPDQGQEADVVRGSICRPVAHRRPCKTVHQIVAEAGFLREARLVAVHPGSLAMVVATLGTGQDEQIIDACW